MQNSWEARAEMAGRDQTTSGRSVLLAELSWVLLFAVSQRCISQSPEVHFTLPFVLCAVEMGIREWVRRIREWARRLVSLPGTKI